MADEFNFLEIVDAVRSAANVAKTDRVRTRVKFSMTETPERYRTVSLNVVFEPEKTEEEDDG